jgi:hypothetical protein
MNFVTVYDGIFRCIDSFETTTFLIKTVKHIYTYGFINFDCFAVQKLKYKFSVFSLKLLSNVQNLREQKF